MGAHGECHGGQAPLLRSRWRAAGALTVTTPTEQTRRSPLYRALATDGARFEPLGGYAVARDFGRDAADEATQAESLGLADLTPFPRHRLQGMEYRPLARRRRRRDGRGEQPGLQPSRRHPHCAAGARRGARACRPQGRRSADRNPRSGLEHGGGRRLLPRGARRDELLAAAHRRACGVHDGQGLRRRPQAPVLRARLHRPD